jgi:hypothetical protein
MLKKQVNQIKKGSPEKATLIISDHSKISDYPSTFDLPFTFAITSSAMLLGAGE